VSARGLALAGAAVIIVGGGVATAVSWPFGGSSGASSSPGPDATSLAPVTRQSLSSQTSVSGTLGYAGTYTVVVPAGGDGSPSAGASPEGASPGGASSGGSTFTWLPAAGQVVRQGQTLYGVNNSPVTLLYGSVPAYRGLSEGMSGTDVRQLNAALVALGDATRSELDPGSSYFGTATAAAVDRFQAHLGVSETGSLPFGQTVFLPTPARVSGISATLGAPAQPGAQVLQATSTTRQAVADIDATQLPDVTPGAPVSITLPGNQTVPGVVTSVGTVASGGPSGGSGSPGSGSSDGSGGSGSSGGSGGSGGSGATVEVDIRLGDPAAPGTLDQAPVQVNITTATVHDVLAVPVDALLAQPGGYAVEVAAAGARHVVPVSLGLFDDSAGLVQVTGAGLSAGQQVVVPQI
jgi:hypothetical protein